MKIVKAIYGKLTSKNISGINVKPELIIEGQKFKSTIDPFPGKSKVLYVEVEKDDATVVSFVFKASNIIEFDFSTNNCPKCKGSGKQPGSFIEYKDGKKIESTFETTCYTCDAQPISKLYGLQLQKEIEKEKKMWCKCESNTDSYYVPDTSKMKHHWKCKCCKKITQIG